MGELNVLRIGMCGCSKLFNNQFESKHIELPLSHSVFVLKEIFLPQSRYERDILRLFRCHFFFDVHEVGIEDNKYLFELKLNEFVSNGRGRGWKVYIGGMWNAYEKRWKRSGLMTVDEIIEQGIKLLIADFGKEKFERWISLMIPSDWRQDNPGQWFL